MRDTFDEDYILEIFKLGLKDTKYLDIFRQYLKYQYLPTEEYKEIWRAILSEYNLSKKVPTIGVLKMRFKTDAKVTNILSDLRDFESPYHEVTINAFEDYIRENMFRESYDKIFDTFSKDKREAYKIFAKEAKEFAEFSLKTLTLDKVFSDFGKRYSQRETDKIDGVVERFPFPIDALNFFTSGGAETGELVGFLAQSGGGKSFLLSQCGVHIARRGVQVLHAQAEGTRKQCMDRYDSLFTGTEYFHVKENNFTNEKLKRIHKIVENTQRGEVHVDCFEKFGSKSVADIRLMVMDLRKQGTDIKVVIVDYLELLHPGDGNHYDKSPSGEKARHQAVARALKDLAVEQNVLVITATQASSVEPDMLNNPSFVMTRFNIGADKDKTQPFDLFITVNRTKDEKKQNICRLWIDKAREHPGEEVIYIVQDLKHSRFYNRKRTLEEFWNNDTIPLRAA